MRTYSFDLVEGNPQRLITMTRVDEVVKRFSTWAQPITIDGVTWNPVTGIALGDMTERSDGTVPSTTIDVAWEIGGTIDPIDVADKLYEDATVLIEITNADNPITRDFDFYGRIGRVTMTTVGLVTFELRNPFGFDREILVPKFTLPCRHDFGNRFCQMPLLRPELLRSTAYTVGTFRRFQFDSDGDPEDYRNRVMEVTSITTGITSGSVPSFTDTIAGTTVDGGVTWTTRDALERAVRIGSVVDHHNVILDRHPITGDVDNYFNPGGLYMMSGRAKGRRFRLGGWVQSTMLASSFQPLGRLVVADDWAFIWQDCDKTKTMCNERFSNSPNYGGFDHFEGAKAVSTV